jgi:diguanylate cyclase (GGDEF)-like protein
MLQRQMKAHRDELATALGHRIELLRLERRHEEVSRAHEQLQEALARAQAKDAELTHAATHDPLTGLLNRAAVIDRIDLVMARHRSDSGRFAVAFVDLDGFKQINDEFGHSVGDQALVEVAEQLRATVRDGDVVARIGGDEFLIVMEALRDEDAVAAWARRLAKALRQASIREWSGRDVGASVGVCLVSGDTPSSPADIIMAADTAMYDAKRSGSGVVVRTLA